MVNIEELTEKINVYSKYFHEENTENAKVQQLSEMTNLITSLKRRTVFLEKEVESYIKYIQDCSVNNKDMEIQVTKKVVQQKEEIFKLQDKLKLLEEQQIGMIDAKIAFSLQDSVTELLLKQKELQNVISEMSKLNNEEISLLKNDNIFLQSQVDALQKQLIDATNTETLMYSEDNIKKMISELAETKMTTISEKQRADHINSLYKLVKEQLKNTDDKFLEFEKFIKDLMHKNFLLQENIKVLEDKIMFNVTIDEYDELKKKYIKLLEENQLIVEERNKAKLKIKELEISVNSQTLWSNEQEFELLSLKHLIVDLQAKSDEKAIIARISTDLINLRIKEAETQNTIHKLKGELVSVENGLSSKVLKLEDEKLTLEIKEQNLKEKLR